jgi:hypothetical protein
MAVPVLSTSTPADGATDVFINKPITVVFDAALLASSITVNSVLLQNVATGNNVDVILTYTDSTNTVRITTLSVLAEDTVYSLKFIGTDIAVSSSYALKSSGGDPLLTTLVVTFTTGNRTYIDDTSIDKDATDLSLEGDLNLPVHVKALGDFSVQSTLPINHSYDVATTINGSNQIGITFNKALSGSACDDSWVTVDVFGMLDDSQFIASSGVFGTGTIPSMTGVSCTDSTLWLNFDGEIPNNVAVEVTIGTGVLASDGSEFGPSEYVLTFTTDRYPKVSGIHVIEREIKAATDELNRDYVAALLLANTVYAMQKFGFDLAPPSFQQSRWVMLKTIVDILDDKELEKALVDGTRRQLGDFNVSIDPKQSEGARLALKHARALKDIDKLERTFKGRSAIAMRYNDTKVIGGIVNRMWHGVAGKLIDTKWAYYQPNVPAANSSINRKAKTPPTSDWY